MPLAVSLSQTKKFRANELVTNGKLNLLGRIIATFTGQASSAQIEDIAVTDEKTALGAHFFCVDAGAANAAVLTPSNGETLAAYSAGLVVAFAAIATNTGTMTAKVGSLAVKTIYKHKNVALEKGDIRAGQIVTLRYDDAAGAWQLQSGLGNAPHVAATDSSGTPNVITLTPSPALTALYTGLLVTFKAANTSTANVTINISGLGATALRKTASVEIPAGDIVSGQSYTAYYDGTQFLLVGAPATAVTPINPVCAVSRNLVIKRATVDTVTITADEVMLTKATGNGAGFLARSVSLTCTFNAGVGLNQLETGASDAADTFYYLWLISDGTNTRCVAGLSSSAPDLSNVAFTDYQAAGYHALIGVCRNDGSSNLYNFYQAGNECWAEERAVFTSSAGSTSYTSAALTNYVPAIARAVRGNYGVSTNNSKNFAVASDSNGLAQQQRYMDSSGGVYNTFYASDHFHLGMPTAQTIYYKTTDTGSYYRLTVTGWTL